MFGGRFSGIGKGLQTLTEYIACAAISLDATEKHKAKEKHHTACKTNHFNEKLSYWSVRLSSEADRTAFQ